MQTDIYNVQHFMALSELYFRLTGKSSNDINSKELIEFFEAINDCSPPATSPEQYLS